MTTRYEVRKSVDIMGNSYIGGPLTMLETDDFNEAYHYIKTNGGVIIDRVAQNLTDSSGESCAIEDAGIELS